MIEYYVDDGRLWSTPGNGKVCVIKYSDYVAELERLRKALWFYADEENYTKVRVDFLQMDSETMQSYYTTKIEKDNGEIARKALERKEGEKE